jgi:lysyl-tRNA synthetase class 1
VHRLDLFDVLARYQTEARQTVPREERRRTYFPYRVYCSECGKDTPTLLGYDAETRAVQYSCSCNGEERTGALSELSGKLMWKIDWPMRWAHEKVDFEPGGEDHSSPGSSYTVGIDVAPHFGWRAPSYIGYGFVGFSGMTKMSSSAGAVPTPAMGLRYVEPSLLRFLYLRRPPRTKFTIDFGQEIWRQYDEWDAFCRRAKKQEVPPLHTKVIGIASDPPGGGLVRKAKIAVGFRVLSGAADMCDGNRAQIARVVRDHLDGAGPADDEALLAALEPRLSCALSWARNELPEEDRLKVRPAFAADRWAELDEGQREAVGMLVEGLEDHWGLSALTHHLYGVEKRRLGLPLDVKPTPELKVAQRAFFQLLYDLLLDAETGPRLPTLLLSLGLERARELLHPAA